MPGHYPLGLRDDGCLPPGRNDGEDTLVEGHWAASRPAHVNINTIELMPVAQSFAPFQVYRQGSSQQ